LAKEELANNLKKLEDGLEEQKTKHQVSYNCMFCQHLLDLIVDIHCHTECLRIYCIYHCKSRLFMSESPYLRSYRMSYLFYRKCVTSFISVSRNVTYIHVTISERWRHDDIVTEGGFYLHCSQVGEFGFDSNCEVELGLEPANFVGLAGH
jgi:hypothetical protein